MNEQIPERYQPLSPWSYFWLQILFSIPVVGFIFLIVFSLSSGNINRRNFARSYFCIVVVLIIVAVLAALFGGSLFADFAEYFNSLA